MSKPFTFPTLAEQCEKFKATAENKNESIVGHLLVAMAYKIEVLEAEISYSKRRIRKQPAK